jgi:nitrile hydratase accessory protein
VLPERPAGSELVFHDEWERRAFALAVGLAEQGAFEWAAFQRRLIRAVAEAEHQDPQNPTRGSYESWLVALEWVLVERRVLEA